jgi:hypothetical protein
MAVRSAIHRAGLHPAEPQPRTLAEHIKTIKDKIVEKVTGAK